VTNFNSSPSFSEKLNNVKLPPFTTGRDSRDNPDIGIADNNNFQGGTPEGLTAGQSTSVSLTFDTDLDPSEVESKFSNVFNDSSKPLARFQAVGSDGKLSDKVKGNITQQKSIPFEAEGTMGLVALGGYLWYRNRKKRKQVLSQESNS